MCEDGGSAASSRERYCRQTTLSEKLDVLDVICCWRTRRRDRHNYERRRTSPAMHGICEDAAGERMALDKGRPQRLWTRLVTRASSDDNTHTTKRRAHASTPPGHNHKLPRRSRQHTDTLMRGEHPPTKAGHTQQLRAANNDGLRGDGCSRVALKITNTRDGVQCAGRARPLQPLVYYSFSSSETFMLSASHVVFASPSSMPVFSLKNTGLSTSA